MKSLLLVVALLCGSLGTPSDKTCSPLSQLMSYQETSCNVLDQSATVQLHTSLINNTIFTGYLKVRNRNITDTRSSLAYIFYGSNKAKSIYEIKKFPTIIWLSGGPGLSSMVGNYLEVGPVLINDNGDDFRVNPYTWIKEYNLMFVDQPLGTGFGQADPVYQSRVEPNNTQDVADQFVGALGSFLQCLENKFSIYELGTVTPWFILGEGYSGKIVPYIAESLMKNHNTFKLKGILLSNPFTDPQAILSEMPSYAYNMGLLDSKERQLYERAAMNGVLNVVKEQWEAANKTFMSVQKGILEASGKTNIYNIFNNKDFTKQLQFLSDYMNDPQMKYVLNFDPNVQFDLNLDYSSLWSDFMQGHAVEKVEYLLQNKLSVLIYNGQNNMLVPNTATTKWVYNLNYPYTKDFQSLDFTVWKIEGKGKVLGYYKTVANLELRIINQAGHYSAYDQPEAAFDMIKTFIEMRKDW